MTDSNHEYKKKYAALVRQEYPSFPVDPLAFAEWTFGDAVITEELFDAKKSKMLHQVACYGLQKYTRFCALLATGLTKEAAFAEVQENFLGLFRDWMETPEFLRRREINAKNHEKWLLRQHRRVGM